MEHTTYKFINSYLYFNRILHALVFNAFRVKLKGEIYVCKLGDKNDKKCCKHMINQCYFNEDMKCARIKQKE